MRLGLFALPLSVALSCAPPPKEAINRVAKQIDVFIGTTGGGNMHPGATTPFGMIALSPHTETQDWVNMGYNHADSFIIGFVHNQVSGIGCSEYGNFLVMPARNCIVLENFGYKSPRADERAKPGYYSTLLTTPNVRAELAATARTAHHRYTFKQNAKGDTLKLIFNMSRCSFPQTPKHSEASVESDGIIHGFGIFKGGFGSDPSEMQAFFSAKPSKKPDFISVYRQSEIFNNRDSIQAGENEECGVILGWIADKNEEVIELTSAISYKSVQNSDAYIYAGKADRVQFFSRDVLKKDFRVAPDGYKGNDDSGTLSAWYVWASLGLFPNAGQDWYFVGSPVFTKAVMKLENGNTLVINAPNTSEKNVYVKSLKLNGVPIERAWIRHSEIANGATLDFEMTSVPTDWGSKQLPHTTFAEKSNN